jgi:hypothetical protein
MKVFYTHFSIFNVINFTHSTVKRVTLTNTPIINVLPVDTNSAVLRLLDFSRILA